MGYALQMSWQPSLLNQKGKSRPPLGLKNLGNTCYINSVLQCLTYTPPLANFCLKYLHSSSCVSAKVSAADKKSECPFCIIEKRIVRSLSLEAALDSPVKISKCLKVFAEHFRHGRQEDAHEFLRYVIDACHNTCLRTKKMQQRRKGESLENGNGNGSADGHTVVEEIFGGALQSQVKCLSCGAESNKVDEIMDISLDIFPSGSLKEALQRFFHPEVLDGNNKYKCENCKKFVAARKQMSILQAPNILVIQLKRFEGIFGGKIDKEIAVEEVLVLSSYMCDASEDLYPEYNLIGTIVHSGFSADSGHYYAYIKDTTGRWYCCNDSYVSVSTLQEVLSEKVYILFFSRIKQRPVSSRTGLVANGKKSHESNGSFTFQIPGSGSLEKPTAKQSADHHSPVVNQTTAKVNKVPSSPSKKLNVSGNFNSGRPPAAGNIKILVHKRESLQKKGKLLNGAAKEKRIKSVVDKNGAQRGESADAIVDGKNIPIFLANGNDKIYKSATDISLGHLSDVKERSKISMETGPEKELITGGVRGSSENSALKRKFQEEDRCILLAKDAISCAKMEDFKEIIGKEAYLFLQSCGWSDKVYNFMNSRKKLCAQRAGNDASNGHELKRLLITDAKSNFISQIPESLKGSLIGRLRSFSQEKQSSTT